MKLIYRPTGLEVHAGMRLPLQGVVYEVTDCEKPHKAAAEGYINAKNVVDGAEVRFYCGVFDCEWVEREDREEPKGLLIRAEYIDGYTLTHTFERDVLALDAGLFLVGAHPQRLKHISFPEGV